MHPSHSPPHGLAEPSPALNTHQTDAIIRIAGKALGRSFYTVQGALRALEKAGYWGHQPAVEAVRKLKPVLEEIVFCLKDNRLRNKAIEIIEEIFFAQQSVCFDVQLPHVSQNIHEIGWEGILKKNGVKDVKPHFVNRSLISEIDDHDVLVVKFMRPKDSLEDLTNEIKWMLHLGRLSFEKRFVIPEPLVFGGSYVFRLSTLPVRKPHGLELHPGRYAIAFIVHKDYFVYPNSPNPSERLSAETFLEVMNRCAFLLGTLTTSGIIHTDIIALFHNRVQAQRRLDKGRYCWWQGYVGRLDRWLASCDWPNFGLSGIRDFEHLMPFSGHLQKLFHYIGDHLLGLFLVAGSYFRNKDRTKEGLDKNGEPVDVWYLFDKGLFKDLVRGIIGSYYYGLTGKIWQSESFVFDLNVLIERMVEEMGTDKHMVEKLRIRDQRDMTPSEFRETLKSGGYSADEIDRFEQGKQEIDIMTGPHLGEFNGEIALPEMVDLIRKVAMLFTIHGFTRPSHDGITCVCNHDSAHHADNGKSSWGFAQRQEIHIVKTRCPSISPSFL